MAAVMTAFVAPVRMKKRDGQAEFTDKALRWTCDDPEPTAAAAMAPIVVPWGNVQDQQVSSATSPKAMIRLRLTNNAVLTMEFLSNKSLDHAFEVRDRAKDWIARSLAARGVKQKASGLDRAALCNPTEIKQRAALLAATPTLKRQHTEMVNQGLISEEDFWASRRHLIANEASKRQKLGKTSAILTDLAGDNEAGGHVVKYNLNAEVIHQIFIQYPAVHLAYEAQVPDKMSETEFWSAFFKSKYFHRDRKAGGHEDMFTKFEEKEKALLAEQSVDPRGLVDPLIDLTATEEDAAGHSAIEQIERRQRQEPTHITIAKFNRHGAYVLDPAHAGKLKLTTSEMLKKARTGQHHDNLSDATTLDDLKQAPPPPYNPLTIEDDSKYFQHSEAGGISSARVLAGQAQQATTLADACAQFHATCSATLQLERAFPSAKNATDILSEIISNADSSHDASASSTASLVSGAIAADCIPNEFKKQVYAQFHDVSELLRHFLSFKARVARTADADAKQKLKRIVERMESKYDELVKIREALPPHEKNLLAPLLKPFDDQLNLAFI